MVAPSPPAARHGGRSGDRGDPAAPGRRNDRDAHEPARTGSRLAVGASFLRSGSTDRRAHRDSDGRTDGHRGSIAVSEVRYDVVVVGGGPGGASAATFLVRGGLKVALFEREVFPRFHVGESLMPATMLLLEQMGVRSEIEARGFQIKYGAMFFDEEHGQRQTFYFLPGQAWPNYSYQVPRAEFDTLLLDHTRRSGATIFQPATVDSADFDPDGVTVRVTSADGPLTVRAAMLVDASGRSSFLASRFGERRRRANLGKVALFTHFRGADRLSGKEEGNIRVYLFHDGWFWWIPLANDLTSVGAVMHARTARAWTGTGEDLYAAMIARCKPVADALAPATRVTAVYREANFAYDNQPIV